MDPRAAQRGAPRGNVEGDELAKVDDAVAVRVGRRELLLEILALLAERHTRQEVEVKQGMEELVLLEAVGAVDVVLLEGIACHLLLLDRVHRERVELGELVKVHHAVAVCVGQRKVLLQKVLLLLGIPSRRYLSKLPEDIEEL